VEERQEGVEGEEETGRDEVEGKAVKREEGSRRMVYFKTVSVTKRIVYLGGLGEYEVGMFA
jgi:hypothetical protein